MPYTTYQGQNHSNNHETDVERNARLAQHLIIYLRAKQERTGAWPGRDLGHSLRYTSHALEALHLLGSKAFPRVISNGVHWLLNLPDEISEGSSEWTNVRLHPSRFKTLAKLGEFSDEKLNEDFAELCTRIGQDGLLSKVLEDQLLGSMIVVDCLLELGTAAQSFDFYERVLDATIPAIETGLYRWYKSDRTSQNSSLVDNIGEASYALDLLLRSRHIELDHELCAPTRQAMLEALGTERNARTLEKDALYSAIQLIQYYPRDPEVVRTVSQFHQHLRTRYEQNNVQRWIKQDDIQPMVLRVLLACGGAEIRQSLDACLWEEAFASRQQHDSEQRSERNRRLEQVIRQRTKIDIRNVQELTGGITAARVFRVEYAINEDGVIEQNHLRRGSTRIVIKRDNRTALEQSIVRYKSLPADIQVYFARHASTPEVVDPLVFAPAFLVLEDLTEEYVTFREILDAVDRRRPSPDDKECLLQTTDAIIHSLFDIYAKTRRSIDDIGGFQTSRLYLSRLDRSLLDMAASNRFPKLKDFFRGFTWVGPNGEEEHFKSIGYYQQIIYRHLDRFRPPCLVMMHGDCHSRNIMLDNCYEHVKFIDLDKLDASGDYMLDIALLFEDVALFRRYFDEMYRFFLRPEDVDLDAGLTRITFPIRVTETALLFQQTVMQHINGFAERFNDRYYRERLWLGIALHLLRLVDKQADLRVAAALYVEAIRLLNALVEFLTGHQTLPAVPIEQPFSRTKIVAPQLQVLHGVIIGVQAQVAKQIKYELRANGAVVRYFINETQTPFAILDGKGAVMRLMLACSPRTFDSLGVQVQEISEGKFRAALTIDRTMPEIGNLIESVAKVAIQAVQFHDQTLQ